jgi:hypothetical protein
MTDDAGETPWRLVVNGYAIGDVALLQAVATRLGVQVPG